MSQNKRGARLYKRVEKEIKKIGIVAFAVKLGYRSPSVFSKWKASQEVPACACGKVESYFKAKNGAVLLEGI